MIIKPEDPEYKNIEVAIAADKSASRAAPHDKLTADAMKIKADGVEAIKSLLLKIQSLTFEQNQLSYEVASWSSRWADCHQKLMRCLKELEDTKKEH